jgi:bla regulator protein BlaR1
MKGRLVMRSLMAVVVIALLNAPQLRAQSRSADASSPAFEVASVKPNKSGDGRILLGMQPGGRFTATNVPLRELIRMACGIQSFQIVGGPDWIGSERFDVLAKAEGDPPPPSVPGGPPGPMLMMLRSLLAERFKLAAHNETRELPIYSMVMARPDRRLGPRLSVAQADCAAIAAAARRGGPPPTPPPGERPRCGMMIGPGNISAGGVPIAQLATMLSMRVSRVVLDRTELTGNFDFTLDFTPEQLPKRAPGTPADQPIRMNGVDIDPDGASIFTALQEQLGLKLESTRGPVEVLVIDRVEQPTPD